MLYHVALGAFALLVNTPAAPPLHVVQQTATRPVVDQRMAQQPVFPTTVLTADLLDDFAAEEAKKDAIIEAKKAALRAKQAEIEKKAQQDADYKIKREQERAEKAAQAKALAEQAKAAKAAEIEKARAAREEAGLVAKAPSKAPRTRIAEVEKIDKRAERKLSGEEVPEFFWNPR